MQVNSTTSGRTLTLHVPWDSAQGCDWTDEGINIEVDIRTLLQTILPLNCLREKNCCATKFACEDEVAAARERKPLPPVEEPRLMTKEQADEADFVWEGDNLIPLEAMV